MRIGILDLGTNTFNFLVRETSTDEVVLSTKIPVKLGQGGIDQGVLAPAAFERGINALAEHQLSAKKAGVEGLYAFATSAIRSASNGPEFVRSAEDKLGIRINVIDGKQEAAFIGAGVREAVHLQEDVTYLVMDIGGGSTEFLLMDAHRTHFMESYLLGVSRLLEKFRPHDPMLPEEIEEVEQYLDTCLESLDEACKNNRPQVLLGSSGSFDTLAEMCLKRFAPDETLLGKTFFQFDLHQYHLIHRQLLQSSFDERLNMPGMLPMRADMLVFSTLFIQFILKRFGIKHLMLSTYALKEGVYMELKNDPTPWRASSL